jgi:hypothetical protein
MLGFFAAEQTGLPGLLDQRCAQMRRRVLGG